MLKKVLLLIHLILFTKGFLLYVICNLILSPNHCIFQESFLKFSKTLLTFFKMWFFNQYFCEPFNWLNVRVFYINRFRNTNFLLILYLGLDTYLSRLHKIKLQENIFQIFHGQFFWLFYFEFQVQHIFLYIFFFFRYKFCNLNKFQNRIELNQNSLLKVYFLVWDHHEIFCVKIKGPLYQKVF